MAKQKAQMSEKRRSVPVAVNSVLTPGGENAAKKGANVEKEGANVKLKSACFGDWNSKNGLNHRFAKRVFSLLFLV